MKTHEASTDPPGSIDLFSTLESQRSVRRLRPDPVPEEIIRELIFWATRAPSGGNRQPWEFVVVFDQDRKHRIGEIYWEASHQVFEDQVENATDEKMRRVYKDAMYLGEHIGESPVLVLVCAQVQPGRSIGDLMPSIYPAVQNLMLAARARGLGSCLTTVHRRRDEEIRELLNVPEGIETVCLIPIGYPTDPERAFRPSLNRRPVEEVLHFEQF